MHTPGRDEGNNDDKLAGSAVGDGHEGCVGNNETGLICQLLFLPMHAVDATHHDDDTNRDLGPEAAHDLGELEEEVGLLDRLGGGCPAEASADVPHSGGNS